MIKTNQTILGISLLATCGMGFLSIFLTACQPNLIEPDRPTPAIVSELPATLTVTPTPDTNYSLNSATPTSPTEEQAQSLYGSMLGDMLDNYYADMADPTIPLATKLALLEGLATIEAEATFEAQPLPPYDPNDTGLDIDIVATLITIDNLTETPPPTFVPASGIGTPMAYDFIWGYTNTWIRNNWQGIISGSPRGANVGRIILGDGENSHVYGLVHDGEFHITEQPIRSSLGILEVVNNQYLILDVFDDDGLPTGQFYYFDMVAREFMVPATAELLLETLQATPIP